jgi:UDP-2,4-diacetamido-2,4,6-trideoxy-beta-L-altropyranose hydrolase
MKIAFRTDASVQIGTGHVMRCITLANELAREGHQCLFICRAHEGHLGELIASKGFELYLLSSFGGGPEAVSDDSDGGYAQWLGVTWQRDAKQTQDCLAPLAADWLVVDHYALGVRWESAIAAAVGQIMVIDDLADREHCCNLLLDQNWFGDKTDARYDKLVGNNCKKLLGPKYAILAPEFAVLRSLLSPRDGFVRRVLVFFGGSDPANVTARALEALTRTEFNNLLIDVVLGVNHPDPQGIAELASVRSGIFIRKGLPSLAGIMARADLMIGAGGSTTWECMCLGLPSLVISIADNQTSTSRALSAAGYVNFLGEMDAIATDDIARSVREAKSDPILLSAQSTRAQSLVPGFGGANVVSFMFDEQNK